MKNITIQKIQAIRTAFAETGSEGSQTLATLLNVAEIPQTITVVLGTPSGTCYTLNILQLPFMMEATGYCDNVVGYHV